MKPIQIIRIIASVLCLAIAFVCFWFCPDYNNSSNIFNVLLYAALGAGAISIMSAIRFALYEKKEQTRRLRD